MLCLALWLLSIHLSWSQTKQSGYTLDTRAPSGGAEQLLSNAPPHLNRGLSLDRFGCRQFIMTLPLWCQAVVPRTKHGLTLICSNRHWGSGITSTEPLLGICLDTDVGHGCCPLLLHCQQSPVWEQLITADSSQHILVSLSASAGTSRLCSDFVVVAF